MKKEIKLIIILVLAIAIVIGAAVLYNILAPKLEINNLDKNHSVTGESDEEAVYLDFTVEDINGNKVKLSDFEGTPVVLNFWASWCGPCKSEMPEFDKMCDKYEGKVAFVMVNLTDGYQETKESALSFVTGRGFDFPVYFDTESEASIKYGITSIPQTFFIDKKGHIVAEVKGAIGTEILEEGIGMIYDEQ